MVMIPQNLSPAWFGSRHCCGAVQPVPGYCFGFMACSFTVLVHFYSVVLGGSRQLFKFIVHRLPSTKQQTGKDGN